MFLARSRVYLLKQMTAMITTRHCSLEPVTMHDVAELHSLWTRPEVREFLWDNEVISFSHTERIVRESAENMELQKYGLWHVSLREKPGMIGFGGFWPFHEPQRIELVFGLAPQYWGRGYATEFGRALIRFGREELTLNTILASTDMPNRASIAVLQRLGFKQTACDDKSGTCFFELPREAT